MTRYSIKPEAIDQIKALCSSVTAKDGKEWLYMPFWFTQDGPESLTVASFEFLPEDVKEAIKAMRKS